MSSLPRRNPGSISQWPSNIVASARGMHPVLLLRTRAIISANAGRLAASAAIADAQVTAAIAINCTTPQPAPTSAPPPSPASLQPLLLHKLLVTRIGLTMEVAVILQLQPAPWQPRQPELREQPRATAPSRMALRPRRRLELRQPLGPQQGNLLLPTHPVPMRSRRLKSH